MVTNSAGVLETVGVDVPAFDHNPTTGESLGLLVEEARTNSVTNNTMVGAVAGTPGTLPTGWGTFVSPTGLTRTIVGSGTVNGINYIDVRFNGTPSSTGEITLYLSPVTTATLAQAWTATAWLSLAGGSTSNIAGISLRNFELNSGAYVREISTNFVSSISSDFVRRQNITTSFGASANQIQTVLSINATAGGTPIDITLRIGLPQLEQGAFATSVIQTSTAAATRAADVVSITGSAFSSWYRQDEGTMFVDGSTPAFTNTTGFVAINAAGNTNRLEIRQSRNTPNVTGASVDVTWANIYATPALVANTSYKQATAVSNASHGNSIAGSLDTSSTAIGTIAATQLFFGTRSSQTAPTGGSSSTIRRFTFWTQRLPNPKLQSITQ
jgi:hypothetical protein